MPEKVSRPLAQIKQSIGEKSAVVKTAATKLSERIQHFQVWLNNLPGRVETTYWRAHPDADPGDCLEFGLKLHRAGKEWTISYGTYHPSYEGYPIDWKPLSEASIGLKIFAVGMFPGLLQAIEKSQDELVVDIDKACTEFDSFATKLGMVGKERQ